MKITKPGNARNTWFRKPILYNRKIWIEISSTLQIPATHSVICQFRRLIINYTTLEDCTEKTTRKPCLHFARKENNLYGKVSCLLQSLWSNNLKCISVFSSAVIYYKSFRNKSRVLWEFYFVLMVLLLL